MKRLKKLLLLVVLWISLFVFLLVTDPETIFLPLLIIPFILLPLSLFLTSEFVFTALLRNVSKKRVRVMSSVVALLPTLLLVLSSVKQLTIRDSVIVIGLLIVLLFYMRRVDFLAP